MCGMLYSMTAWPFSCQMLYSMTQSPYTEMYRYFDTQTHPYFFIEGYEYFSKTDIDFV